MTQPTGPHKGIPNWRKPYQPDPAELIGGLTIERDQARRERDELRATLVELKSLDSQSALTSALTAEQEIRARALALADPGISRGADPWRLITRYAAYITDGTTP